MIHPSITARLLCALLGHTKPTWHPPPPVLATSVAFNQTTYP